MGRALAEEAIALDVDVILGPGANVKRTPLCGRNFAYFSEDPCLAGEMAASLISGIQELCVGASLKHFAANNQQHRRKTVSAEIDERTLREIYLPAFETAMKKAHPWKVMCAYNRINGLYASQNPVLLADILKRERRFYWSRGALDGVIGAVSAGVAQVLAVLQDIAFVQDILSAPSAHHPPAGLADDRL